MGNINLTKILFASLVGTFVMGALFGVYSAYVVLNDTTIDEPYNSALQQIGQQYNGFSDVAGQASDKGLVTSILDFGKAAITGTVNVFVVGLDAIGKFFSMIPLIGNVIEIISTVIPGISSVLGLLVVIIALYIPMRYIQSVSNKQELP